MSPTEIKSIVTQISDDSDKGNLDAVYRHMADGYVFHRAPYADLVGIEANRKGDEALTSAFKNAHTTIQEIVVEGDTAAMRYTWQAVHAGTSPLSGIPATGKTVTVSGCMIFHWQGDKLIEQWDFSDGLGLMQQLGVVPARG